MSQNSKQGKIFNEVLLESSGLNINLTDQFYLSDIIRVELDYELRKELVKEYIKINLPLGFKVLDSEPESLEKNSLFIFNDFSCMIFTNLAKVAVNRIQENFISFFHDKAKSYSLISIVLNLASFSDNQDLKSILDESVNLITLIKLKSNIISFLYSISKINARVLMNKCNEAKALFSSESVQSSQESLKLSSASCKNKPKLPSDESLHLKNSQFSESLEYSQSVLSEDCFLDRLLSQSSALNEDKGKNLILPDLNAVIKFAKAETPDAQLKQFEMSSGKIKLLYKLHDSGIDSTCPIGEDGDKSQNLVFEESRVRSPEHSGCCKCEKCVCF